jgi:hypothetical protein
MINISSNIIKQINFNRILIVIIILSICSCQGQKKVLDMQPCATKYPILLVHGVSFRDDVPIIKYWSRIPKALEKNGAKVFLAHTNAFNSHVENA